VTICTQYESLRNFLRKTSVHRIVLTENLPDDNPRNGKAGSISEPPCVVSLLALLENAEKHSNPSQGPAFDRGASPLEQ
jgi:hypothetical protein